MQSHHILTHPDTNSEKYYRTRYHYLLQIIFGETIAIDYCRTIANFAPLPKAREFLLQQQTEEERHLELLTQYVGSHPRPNVLISPYLKKLDALMSHAIAKRDYTECIFIQNFIVEGLNITLLRELEHHTDGVLSELCTTILKDEIKHMEFGVSEVRRILNEDTQKKTRKKLIRLQRITLLYATGLATTLARESKHIGIPMHEFAEKAVDEHFLRVVQAGLLLPLVDRIFFAGVKVFLKVF